MPSSSALLIHTPILRYHTYPFWDISFVNFMPMGLLAIADYATRRGHPTRVLHYGLASWRGDGFDLENYVRRLDPCVIGLPLHWFLASHDVIALAERLHRSFPEIPLVLGGYTASYFAEEILAQYSSIAAVIRGDGEVGFADLCAAVAAGNRDWSAVRNLVWRRDDRVVTNPRIPTDEALFNELDYTNFDLAEFKEQLPELHWIRFPRQPRLDRFFRRRAEWGRPFILAAMRGCAYDCAYCGGSQTVHEALFGRRDPIVRRPELIASDYEKAIALGYDRGWMNTDPNSVQPDYYRGFFDSFRRRNCRPLLHYEFYQLPNEEFLDRFRDTCDPASRLNLTLESGSETVRAKYRGIKFTNAEMVETIRQAARRDIPVDLYLINNFPEAEHIAGSRRFVRSLRKIDGLPLYLAYYVGIMADPGCDMFKAPGRYDIDLTRRRFADFVAATSRPLVDVGYYPLHPRALPGQHWRWWGYKYPAFLANGLVNFMIYLVMRTGLAKILPERLMRAGDALFRAIRRFTAPAPKKALPADNPPAA